MIIDAHTHVFDRSIGGSDLIFPRWPGTRWGSSGIDLIRQMDAAGIDKAVLISYTPIDIMAMRSRAIREEFVATYQHYLSRAYAVQVWQEHPDRFFWFADSIDPRVPGYVERAEQSLEQGASGLKLLPLFVDTEIGDPRWRPIFELLRKWKVPCTVDLSWWLADVEDFAPSVYGLYSSYRAYSAGMERVARDFRDVTFIIAHYGTPRLCDRDDPVNLAVERSGGVKRSIPMSGEIHYDRLDGQIELFRSNPNLMCELGAYGLLINPGESYPYLRALRVIERLVEALGADRIIWGTDWPYIGEQSHTELIRAIRGAPFLSEAEADLILGGTASRVLCVDPM